MWPRPLANIGRMPSDHPTALRLRLRRAALCAPALLALLACLPLAGPARAQSPTQPAPQVLPTATPLRLVVPFTPGTGIDLIARQIGPKLSDRLGRPVVVTEACAALGTSGDIILWDPKGYLSVVKTGGVRSDVSIHLWFDQSVTAFRFVMRMNGQPWLGAAVARKNGSNTLSTVVALAAR